MSTKAVMTAEAKQLNNETEIRNLIDRHARAVRAKEIDGAMLNVEPNAILFDVVNPLEYVGADMARKRLEEWFSSFEGPIGFENRGLKITASDDVAFCHSLNQVRGTKTDGQKIEMWWRATVCYRKIEGTWMVTHEHASVPFDVESGKASLNLKPQQLLREMQQTMVISE